MPPKIIIAPSETEVAEGSTIVMVCEASGRPEPLITWQLNNTDIDRYYYLSAQTTSGSD